MKYLKKYCLIIFLILTNLSCFPRMTHFLDNPNAPHINEVIPEIPPVFVQVDADSAVANGTYDYPYPTILEGINAAINTGNPNVMLLAGDYYEVVNLEEIENLTIIGEDNADVILHNYDINFSIFKIGLNTNFVQIKNLTLIANYASPNYGLIEIDAVAGRVVVDGVVFDTTTSAYIGINIADAVTSIADVVVANCVFSNFVQAIIYRPRNLYIANTEFNIPTSSWGIRITNDNTLDFSTKTLEVKDSEFNMLGSITYGFDVYAVANDITLGNLYFKGNSFNGNAYSPSKGISLSGSFLYDGNIYVIPNENNEPNTFDGLQHGISFQSTNYTNIFIDHNYFGFNSSNFNEDLQITSLYGGSINITSNEFYSTALTNYTFEYTANSSVGSLNFSNNYISAGNGCYLYNNGLVSNNDWNIINNTINSKANNVFDSLYIEYNSTVNYLYLQNNIIDAATSSDYSLNILNSGNITCTADNLITNTVSSSNRCLNQASTFCSSSCL